MVKVEILVRTWKQKKWDQDVRADLFVLFLLSRHSSLNFYIYLRISLSQYRWVYGGQRSMFCVFLSHFFIYIFIFINQLSSLTISHLYTMHIQLVYLCLLLFPSHSCYPPPLSYKSFPHTHFLIFFVLWFTV